MSHAAVLPIPEGSTLAAAVAASSAAAVGKWPAAMMTVQVSPRVLELEGRVNAGGKQSTRVFHSRRHLQMLIQRELRQQGDLPVQCFQVLVSTVVVLGLIAPPSQGERWLDSGEALTLILVPWCRLRGCHGPGQTQTCWHTRNLGRRRSRGLDHL